MDSGIILIGLSMAAEIIAAMFILAEIKTQPKETKVGPKISFPEVQISSLKKELEKINKAKTGLEEELSRQKAISGADYTEINRLKKECLETKTSLVGKEQELQKISAQNKTLEIQFNEKQIALQSAEKAQEPKIEKLNAEYSELKNKLVIKEQELSQKQNLLQALEKENNDLKNKEAEVTHVVTAKRASEESNIQSIRKKNKRKIGEILLDNSYVTKEALDKALEYQQKYGTSVTQYLLAYSHIDEAQLAQCLCTQFTIPYLPLKFYEIPEDIIRMIPHDVAEKCLVVPVEKVGDLLTVVMLDPLDTEQLKLIEDATGYTVQPFVGILSEIIAALDRYYKITVPNIAPQGGKKSPFLLIAGAYEGLERRRSISSLRKKHLTKCEYVINFIA